MWVSRRHLGRRIDLSNPPGNDNWTILHKMQWLRFAGKYRHLPSSTGVALPPFILYPIDGHLRARRLANATFSDACVTPTIASKGGSVHVHLGGVCELMHMYCYVNATLSRGYWFRKYATTCLVKCFRESRETCKTNSPEIIYFCIKRSVINSLINTPLIFK